MTKATIRSNLSSFIPDISATRAKGLDYVLGETNSFSCHVRFHLLSFVLASHYHLFLLSLIGLRELLGSAILQVLHCGRWIMRCSRTLLYQTQVPIS